VALYLSASLQIIFKAEPAYDLRCSTRGAKAAALVNNARSSGLSDSFLGLRKQLVRVLLAVLNKLFSLA
jgi:hypothetical protein